MCYPCKSLLYHNESERDTEQEEQDISFKSLCDINKELISACEMSPIKNTKLSQEQLKRKVTSKAELVKAKILKIVDADFCSSSPSLIKQTKSQLHLNKVLEAIHKKFGHTSSYNEKTSLLTLAPKYWSLEKTAEFFETTEYMVREAWKLNKEDGMLAM